jgi:hypothetical protein
MAPNRMSVFALFAALLIPWIGRADPSPPSPASVNHPPVVSIEMEDYSHGYPEHQPKWVFDPKEVAEEYKGIVEARNRLNQTMIPVADFRDAKIRDIFSFLSGKTGELIFINQFRLPDGTMAGNFEEVRCSLHLENVPASEVLRYATTLIGCTDLTFARGVVAVSGMCLPILMGQSAEFKAPSTFEGTPIKNYLASMGVESPPWSKLDYDGAKGTLSAFNTDNNLERIAIILEGLNADPRNIRSYQEITDSLDAWNSLEWKRNLELQIVISVEIHDAPLEKIAEVLQEKVNPWVAARVESKNRVNLSLKNVPVTELLRKIAEQTKTRLVVGQGVIVFVPAVAANP